MSKPFGKWVELGEKGHPGVLTACGGAARVRTGLPSAMGTEDSLSVSSKQGEQKSSPCLMFWESSEVSLHLSGETGGVEVLERTGGNVRKCSRETGRKRLEVNIFHRKKT